MEEEKNLNYQSSRTQCAQVKKELMAFQWWRNRIGHRSHPNNTWLTIKGRWGGDRKGEVGNIIHQSNFWRSELGSFLCSKEKSGRSWQLPWISVGRCPQFPCTNLSFVQGDQQKKHGYSFMLEVMLPAPWCCGNGQLAGQVIGTTHCCLLAKKAMWMDTLRHQVPRTLELNTPFLFVLAIKACPGRPYALTLNFIFKCMCWCLAQGWHRKLAIYFLACLATLSFCCLEVYHSNPCSNKTRLFQAWKFFRLLWDTHRRSRNVPLYLQAIASLRSFLHIFWTFSHWIILPLSLWDIFITGLILFTFKAELKGKQYFQMSL